MSSGASAWNIVTLHPRDVKGQSINAYYVSSDDRQMPDLHAGFKVYNSDRGYAPPPSFLSLTNAQRMESVHNSVGSEHISFLQDKEAWNAGGGAVVGLPLIHKIRVQSDGIPIQQNTDDLGIRNISKRGIVDLWPFFPPSSGGPGGDYAPIPIHAEGQPMPGGAPIHGVPDHPNAPRGRQPGPVQPNQARQPTPFRGAPRGPAQPPGGGGPRQPQGPQGPPRGGLIQSIEVVRRYDPSLTPHQIAILRDIPDDYVYYRMAEVFKNANKSQIGDRTPHRVARADNMMHRPIGVGEGDHVQNRVAIADNMMQHPLRVAEDDHAQHRVQEGVNPVNQPIQVGVRERNIGMYPHEDNRLAEEFFNQDNEVKVQANAPNDLPMGVNVDVDVVRAEQRQPDPIANPAPVQVNIPAAVENEVVPAVIDLDHAPVINNLQRVAPVEDFVAIVMAPNLPEEEKVVAVRKLQEAEALAVHNYTLALDEIVKATIAKKGTLRNTEFVTDIGEGRRYNPEEIKEDYVHEGLDPVMRQLDESSGVGQAGLINARQLKSFFENLTEATTRAGNVPALWRNVAKIFYERDVSKNPMYEPMVRGIMTMEQVDSVTATAKAKAIIAPVIWGVAAKLWFDIEYSGELIGNTGEEKAKIRRTIQEGNPVAEILERAKGQWNQMVERSNTTFEEARSRARTVRRDSIPIPAPANVSTPVASTPVANEEDESKVTVAKRSYTPPPDSRKLSKEGILRKRLSNMTVDQLENKLAKLIHSQKLAEQAGSSLEDYALEKKIIQEELGKAHQKKYRGRSSTPHPELSDDFDSTFDEAKQIPLPKAKAYRRQSVAIIGALNNEAYKMGKAMDAVGQDVTGKAIRDYVLSPYDKQYVENIRQEAVSAKIDSTAARNQAEKQKQEIAELRRFKEFIEKKMSYGRTIAAQAPSIEERQQQQAEDERILNQQRILDQALADIRALQTSHQSKAVEMETLQEKYRKLEEENVRMKQLVAESRRASPTVVQTVNTGAVDAISANVNRLQAELSRVNSSLAAKDADIERLKRQIENEGKANQEAMKLQMDELLRVRNDLQAAKASSESQIANVVQSVPSLVSNAVANPENQQIIANVASTVGAQAGVASTKTFLDTNRSNIVRNTAALASEKVSKKLAAQESKKDERYEDLSAQLASNSARLEVAVKQSAEANKKADDLRQTYEQYYGEHKGELNLIYGKLNSQDAQFKALNHDLNSVKKLPVELAAKLHAFGEKLAEKSGGTGGISPAQLGFMTELQSNVARKQDQDLMGGQWNSERTMIPASISYAQAHGVESNEDGQFVQLAFESGYDPSKPLSSEYMENQRQMQLGDASNFDNRAEFTRILTAVSSIALNPLQGTAQEEMLKTIGKVTTEVNHEINREVGQADLNPQQMSFYGNMFISKMEQSIYGDSQRAIFARNVINRFGQESALNQTSVGHNSDDFEEKEIPPSIDSSGVGFNSDYSQPGHYGSNRLAMTPTPIIHNRSKSISDLNYAPEFDYQYNTRSAQENFYQDSIDGADQPSISKHTDYDLPTTHATMDLDADGDAVMTETIWNNTSPSNSGIYGFGQPNIGNGYSF